MPTSLRPVGRPPEYTPEMDALILSITDGAELLRRFEEMGTAVKSPKAIAARRQYLRKTGFVGSDASPVEARLSHLMAMRRQLTKEIEATTARVESLTEQAAAVDAEIALLADELRGGT